MAKRKKKTLPTQLEVIKGIRKPLAPGGRVILSKKEKPFRKRKHKKLESD